MHFFFFLIFFCRPTAEEIDLVSKLIYEVIKNRNSKNNNHKKRGKYREKYFKSWSMMQRYGIHGNVRPMNTTKDVKETSFKYTFTVLPFPNITWFYKVIMKDAMTRGRCVVLGGGRSVLRWQGSWWWWRPNWLGG